MSLNWTKIDENRTRLIYLAVRCTLFHFHTRTQTQAARTVEQAATRRAANLKMQVKTVVYNKRYTFLLTKCNIHIYCICIINNAAFSTSIAKNFLQLQLKWRRGAV